MEYSATEIVFHARQSRGGSSVSDGFNYNLLRFWTRRSLQMQVKGKLRKSTIKTLARKNVCVCVQKSACICKEESLKNVYVSISVITVS